MYIYIQKNYFVFKMCLIKKHPLMIDTTSIND